MKWITKQVARLVEAVVVLMGQSRFGRYILTRTVEEAGKSTEVVKHNGWKLRFSTPNGRSRRRALTFSVKEPETLEWIDGIPEGAVVWDIGANVGLYSCYAALTRKCQVFSFEPSVFNLELLARNVNLNKLQNNIVIMPLPLSEKTEVNLMKMSNTDLGGALSSFGKDFGWDGKKLNTVFEYQAFGLSMDDAVQVLNIPMPSHVKMDVDGIEHLILNGGQRVMSEVDEILVEVNDNFHEQAELCHKLLTKAGLVLREKRQSEYIAKSISGFDATYNQIWIRQ